MPPSEGNNVSGRTARFWAWYAAAWIPLAVFYGMLMLFPRPVIARPTPTPFVAVAASLSYVVPVALLGVVVWWAVGRIIWPPKSMTRLVLLHGLASILFSGVWLAIQVGGIIAGVGFASAMTIAAGFAGFQFIEGVFIYGLLAGFSHVVRINRRLSEQEARVARAEALRMQAELAALRGQLNPHFLFNTLHTLTALVRRDPETAEHALERFGDMLRYVLDVKRSKREDVSLADELSFVRNYLSLEQLRLGDRLSVVEEIDPEALDCVLPSLTLQPLVENAIKYGVAPRSAGGTITISASLADDALALEVGDDGPGTRMETVAAGKGVGLRAVRQRLETRYPREASFAVTTAPGEGFVVRATLPAHSGAVIPTGAPA